jgi:hypothetical protein
MNLSQGNPSLNYGSVSGLLCFAGFAGAFYAGVNPFGTVTWLWVWVPVLMIVMAIKAVRNIEPGGPFSFGRAFKVGILTAFFSSTLYCLLFYLFGMLVPDVMNTYMEQVEEGMKAAQSFISEDFMDKMYEELEKTTVSDIAFSEFFRKMIGGLLVSLVAAAVLYRKNPIYPAE